MMSLLDAADREYEAIQRGDAVQRKLTVASVQGQFDFLTSDEPKAGPVHVVESRREDARRAKLDGEPRDLSREEFARQLGITEADAADPSSGLSVLSVSEAMLAYYGDPQDEAYRAFRRQLVRFSDNQDWLKQSTFTNPVIEVEVDRMHQVAKWELEDEARASSPLSQSPRDPPSQPTPHSPSEVPQPRSGRTRAANMAANYRKKMQSDFQARREL